MACVQDTDKGRQDRPGPDEGPLPQDREQHSRTDQQQQVLATMTLGTELQCLGANALHSSQCSGAAGKSCAAEQSSSKRHGEAHTSVKAMCDGTVPSMSACSYFAHTQLDAATRSRAATITKNVEYMAEPGATRALTYT